MKIIKNIYLSARFFYTLAGIIVLFVLGFFIPVLFSIAQGVFYVFVFAVAADAFMLFSKKNALFAQRLTTEKFSMGDDNPVDIYIEHYYHYKIKLKIIDELPFQFQKRDFNMETILQPGKHKKLQYWLKPVKRGEYYFGAMNFYVSLPLEFLIRKYRFSQDEMVPVYPSIIQMRKYELLAISNMIQDTGIKKIRRVGHTLEFDQIRNYVYGDDYRSVNWKASARKNALMVNQYQDERSQPVYSLIDKGRVMKLPFDGMTLLDYAINASLVISNIAIKKNDRAGIITFSKTLDTVLPASDKPSQMFKILEVLYNQKTNFMETDYSLLQVKIKRLIPQRSLLLLFTNFESLSGMHRQLPFLKAISKNHLLVVVFFENTELKNTITQKANNTEEIYIQAIAEKFYFEKKLIVKELSLHGIYTILTTPENLSVNTINKYLEFKARGMI